VQTCVTSPPYWGLRDYGVAGQLGLEATPEEYVGRMVEVFREVRRVLRADGTLWLNLGDCYCSAPPGNERPDHTGNRLLPTRGRQKEARSRGARTRALRDGRHSGKHTAMTAGGAMVQPNRRALPGLKPKDLVGIPWRVAFALQADGWWLRQEIIWAKPNPMPEAVLDRPTRAHEQVFLLTKSASYFYDRHAIMEPVTGGAHPRGDGLNPKAVSVGEDRSRSKQNASFSAAISGSLIAQRNRRSVWTITTKPFPGAHFATFPPDLVEPCVLAGSSEAGCCSSCGAPLERVLGERVKGLECAPSGNAARRHRVDRGGVSEDLQRGHQGFAFPYSPSADPTVGWRSSCGCGGGGQSVPCSVLDPFAGAGTTGMVARRLGRAFVGIELNPAFVDMARSRIVGDAPLLNSTGMEVA
jgi:site-specific DNA-methyltransferase (adenine-specific)